MLTAAIGGSEQSAGAAEKMADTMELHKLKLAELKQECVSRGLETKGNKQDLINRLNAYFEEHADEAANEDDVLGEETQEEEPKPVEPAAKVEPLPPQEQTPQTESDKKVVKILTGLPLNERLQKRAERFNVASSLESKKAARAARFGISSASPKGLSVLSTNTKPTVEDDEKLKKRKERFGILTSSAASTEDTEAKKKKRGERFGIA
ncbi:SAP domain-containing ribonucleoprotein [Lissotriton helveticus]